MNERKETVNEIKNTIILVIVIMCINYKIVVIALLIKILLIVQNIKINYLTVYFVVKRLKETIVMTIIGKPQEYITRE